MKSLTLLFVLLGSVSLGAQEKALHAAIIGLNVADLWTTQQAINRGAVESNQLLQNATARIAIKSATTGVELLAVHCLWRENKAGAIGLTVGLIALNGFMTIHNTTTGRGR